MARRKPKDLQGLLRFAVESTKSEDAPNPTQFEQMDEERKKFLEEVLESMTIDVVQRFQKDLDVLASSNSTIEEKIEALQSISEFVNDADHANNLVKLGGDKIIISGLNNSNACVRKITADLIAEMCQHNPFCQSKFGKPDVFQLLIQLLSDGAPVSTSAMYAISCLIRHHEPSLAAFVEVGGLECLSSCFIDSKDPNFVKSCFLISALSLEFPNVRDRLIEIGTVERLANCLKPVSEFDLKIELILSALTAFSGCDKGKCCFQELRLRDLLEEILKLVKHKPECVEIGQYTQKLLDMCLPKIDETAET